MNCKLSSATRLFCTESRDKKYNSQFRLITDSTKSKNSIARRKRGESGAVVRVVLACKSNEEETREARAAAAFPYSLLTDRSCFCSCDCVGIRSVHTAYMAYYDQNFSQNSFGSLLTWRFAALLYFAHWCMWRFQLVNFFIFIQCCNALKNFISLKLLSISIGFHKYSRLIINI